MAISSVGTTLCKWDSVSSEWEFLSNVIQLTVIDAHKDVIPVVKLDSKGGVKSFIQGEVDYGVISLSINYTREVLNTLIEDFQDIHNNQNYMIVLPDNTSVEFEGFISDMPFTAQLDSQLVIDVSIKVTDEIIIGTSTIDVSAPVITLLGSSTVNIEIGETYTDAGVTALDDVDGDITESIVQTGTVDTNTLGTYTIRYNVTDSNGNAATEVTRTVNVVEAALPTVVTLEIENSVYGTPSCSVDFKVNLLSLGTALPFDYVGIYWGTSVDASDYSSGSSDSSLGIKTKFINYNLPPGTLIYYKAYAINAGGTVYGEILSFTTPSS
jgi:hypothetical protein